MSTQYSLKGSSFVLTALALALCTFMEVLDFTITNVSIPYIAGGLGVSDTEGTWVITLYMVGNAIILPISGWLSEKIGPVKLILIASALFGVSSWFCGIAFSFPMLCVSRFLQGAFSGSLIPISQVLLVEIFPEGKKQMALALWAMVALLGPILGPIVGGWITQSFSWRWIFYINIPVALFSTSMIWIFMRKYFQKVGPGKLDIVGLILLVMGITCLQILVDKGWQLDWFASSTIKTLGAISLISLTLFVVYEWNHKDPLVDLKILKIRPYALGTFLQAISFMVFFAPIVVTPLWLETYMGYDSLTTGLALATMGVVPFLSAPLIGKLMSKGLQKWLVAASFLIMGGSFLYFATFNTSVTFSKIAWSRFYFGIGLAGYIAPLLSLALAKVPAAKLARASALLQFFRIFLSGVGTSIFTTIWNNRATFHHFRMVGQLTQGDTNLSLIKQVAMEKFHYVQAPFLKLLNRQVDEQTYMLATNDVMLLSGVIMISLIVVLFWIRISPKEIQGQSLSLAHG